MWDQGLHSGMGGSYHDVFSVWSLLCCSCLIQSISPSTYKISYWKMQIIFCTPWLQKFILVEILLIVQVTFQKISQKPMLEAQAGGLSFYLLGLHILYGHVNRWQWLCASRSSRAWQGWCVPSLLLYHEKLRKLRKYSSSVRELVDWAKNSCQGWMKF